LIVLSLLPLTRSGDDDDDDDGIVIRHVISDVCAPFSYLGTVDENDVDGVNHARRPSLVPANSTMPLYDDDDDDDDDDGDGDSSSDVNDDPPVSSQAASAFKNLMVVMMMI
jgi:hypothetical protein